MPAEVVTMSHLPHGGCRIKGAPNGLLGSFRTYVEGVYASSLRNEQDSLYS